MRGKVWPEPFFVGPQTDFGGGLVSDCDKLWLWQKECVGLGMILWGNASDYELVWKDMDFERRDLMFSLSIID